MGLSRCFRILPELNIENSSRCVEGWAGKKGARHRWACLCQPGGRRIGSVVLEERKQVIVAVRGEVRWAQVGQQLIGVSQFWKQLGTKQT